MKRDDRIAAADGDTPAAARVTRPPIRRPERAILAIAAIVYVAVWLKLPDSVFFSPDEGSRYLQMLATSWQGETSLESAYGAHPLDPRYEFFPKPLPPSHPQHDASLPYPRPQAAGGAEFNWSPLFPLLSEPFARVFGPGGLRIPPLLLGLTIVGLAGALARAAGAGRIGALSTASGVAFATPIAFYSQLYWEHTAATACALGAILLLLRGRSIRHWTGAIGLFALTVHLRQELLLLAAATAAALLWTERRGVGRWLRSHLVPSLVAVLGIVVLGALVLPELPALLGPGLSGWRIGETSVELILAPRFWTSLHERVVEVLVGHSRPSTPQRPLALSLLAVGGLAVAGWAARTKHHRLLILALLPLLGASAWAVVDPLRFRAVHSLMLPMPAMALGLCFALAANQRSTQAKVLAFVMLAYLGLGTVASLPLLFGGLEWGNRYLLTLYPLGAVGAGLFVERMLADGNRAAKGTGLTLWLCATLLGALFQLRGLRELVITSDDLEQYRAELESSDLPTVTDLYWLPGSLAPLFASRPILTVPSPSHLAAVLDLRGGVVRRVRVATIVEDLEDLESWFDASRSRGLQPVDDVNVAGLRFLDFAAPSPDPLPNPPASDPSQ